MAGGTWRPAATATASATADAGGLAGRAGGASAKNICFDLPRTGEATVPDLHREQQLCDGRPVVPAYARGPGCTSGPITDSERGWPTVRATGADRMRARRLVRPVSSSRFVDIFRIDSPVRHVVASGPSGSDLTGRHNMSLAKCCWQGAAGKGAARRCNAMARLDGSFGPIERNRCPCVTFSPFSCPVALPSIRRIT